jgi:membrane-associated phospholipid phosphatase
VNINKGEIFMLKKTFYKQYPLLFLLSIPLLHTIYDYLNKYHTKSATNILTTADAYIPFVPEFIIPYIGWYFFMFFYLFYLCQKDRKIYYESLITINIGMLISYVIYFAFQTTVPRPILVGNDFYTNLVRFIYINDQPYNCFPSIHVLTTFVIMYGIYKSEINSFFHRNFVYLFGLLIIVSTVFVKQHSIIDGIAAVALVILVFSVVEKLQMANVLLSIDKHIKPKRVISQTDVA